MNKFEQLQVTISELPSECGTIKNVAANLLEMGNLNLLLGYVTGVRDGISATNAGSQSLSSVRKIIDILAC